MLAAPCLFSSVPHLISRSSLAFLGKPMQERLEQKNEAAILNSSHAETHSVPFLNYSAPEEETDVWDLLDAGGQWIRL